MPSYIAENATGDSIRLDNLVKIYDTGAIKVLRLKKTNLTIKRGEFVVVMGQPGFDKSTLMDIPRRLDRLTMGHYYLDGIGTAPMNQDKLPAMRNCKIGLVPQSFSLILRTSASEGVELSMTYARKSKKTRRERTPMLLERVGLGARYKHWPDELSGGQCQRVTIARALANESPLTLANEPTDNLGTVSSVEIMELFNQLHKEEAVVMVVTHEENIAAFTDRIIRSQGGQMLSGARNSHDAGRPSGAEGAELCYQRI